MRPTVSGLLSCSASTILSSVSPTSRMRGVLQQVHVLAQQDAEGRLIQAPAIICLQVRS